MPETIHNPPLALAAYRWRLTLSRAGLWSGSKWPESYLRFQLHVKSIHVGIYVVYHHEQSYGLRVLPPGLRQQHPAGDPV
jgi:hypothetical protein